MASQRVKSLFLLGLSLAVAASAQAVTGRQVEENCRGALTARGYPGFSLDESQVQSSRSGWSMNGQMTKGGRRYEFNCVTDEQGFVRDIAVNDLGKASGSGKNAAGAAIAAAAILGVVALASHEKHHKGDPPQRPESSRRT